MTRQSDDYFKLSVISMLFACVDYRVYSTHERARLVPVTRPTCDYLAPPVRVLCDRCALPRRQFYQV